MRRTCVLLVIAAFLAPAAPLRAQGSALEVIPDDALGFVLVNRLGQTNEKLKALAKRLTIPLPGEPLELVLGKLTGVAEQGSFAVGVFPGTAEGAEPRALLVVPVSNYQTFIEPLKPVNPTAEITEVTLANIKPKGGGSMLAGKRGNYALISEERDLLERALKAKKTLATWAEPLSASLAETDVAGVLTDKGVKLIAALARKGIAEGKQNLANLPLPPQAQFLGDFFDAVDGFVKSVSTDVSHASLGARIDASGSAQVSARLGFVPGSGFAKAGAGIKAPAGGPLAGLPSGPFVFAAGGALPQDGLQGLMKFNVEMMKAGGGNISAEASKKLEDAYTQMMKGVTSMSFVWQGGKENQGLFASMAGVMHTSDSAAYLAGYEKSLHEMSEIFKDLNAPFLPSYDIKKVKVDGKPALQIGADFAAALGVPDEVKNMMKIMFGPDAKMTVSLAARDDKVIVMRYTAAESLKELLAGRDLGLGSDASVAQVTKALPAGSQWAFYISPKGLTDFAGRMVKEFAPVPIEVPRFPATPPVGMGARCSGSDFEFRVVVPSEVLDNVADFVKQVKRLMQKDV